MKALLQGLIDGHDLLLQMGQVSRIDKAEVGGIATFLITALTLDYGIKLIAARVVSGHCALPTQCQIGQHYNNGIHTLNTTGFE